MRYVVMAVALMAAVGPAAAQSVTSMDRERGHIMLERVRDQIKDKYYDSTFHGVDLEARARVLGARIDSARNLGDILASVASLPLTLQDSHTAFEPPEQVTRVDYGWDMIMVGDSCYVGYVAPKSDAAQRGLTAGDRVLALNGYPPTRQNLWQLTYLYHVLRPQVSLHVRLAAPDGSEREADLAAAVHEGHQIMDLTSSGLDWGQYLREAEKEEEDARSRWVDFGDAVEVWKLPTFYADDRTIKDGLSRARDHKALVLDLRGNTGGSLDELTRLFGGMSSQTDTVGKMKERKKEEPVIAKGSGERAFKGQLVVLVDSRSASASEIFARSAQLMRRGTVLGDRTRGAVMAANFWSFYIGQDVRVYYGIEITTADFIMADGGRLEGSGVTPDSLILPTAGDMAHARDPVLSRALAMVGVSVSPDSAGKLFERR